jgi:hypothetical protein
MIRSSPDVDTDEVIRSTVLKDLSDSVHVKATRQLVANNIRSVVTAANQDQTQILGTMLDGQTTTIVQCFVTLQVTVDDFAGHDHNWPEQGNLAASSPLTNTS